jgi:hypothetical protein
MIAGIVYSCQFLILTADQPTLAENLMIESGYSMADFLAEQRRTDHENKKMKLVIREAFRRSALKYKKHLHLGVVVTVCRCKGKTGSYIDCSKDKEICKDCDGVKA